MNWLSRSQSHDQIQNELQIIAATIRSKTNQVGTTYQATFHSFYTCLYKLNKQEIIFRAQKEFYASKRLAIFEDASNTFTAIVGHSRDIFDKDPNPEWVQKYLSMCEIRNILEIAALDKFVSSHLLPGQSLTISNPQSIPELSEENAPEYIRNFAQKNLTDKSLLDKVLQLFPPSKQFGIFYPTLPDPI